MATQQSLLEGVWVSAQQRNRGKCGNFEATSHNREQVGEQVPCRRNSTGPWERETECIQVGCIEKFQWGATKHVAEEQHRQLGMYAQSSSTDTESEAEEHEVVRPKMTTALVEIANISQQHAAFTKKSSFQYCARHSQCEKGSSSPNSQYNIVRGGGSWHPWRYGGPAATSARHPNCGKSEGLVQGTNMTGIHPNGGGQCSSKDRDVLCGTGTN